MFFKVFPYLKGLFKSEKNRANCTFIADSLGDLDHQSFNHLLSNSPWNYQEVLQELSTQSNALFCAQKEVALIIDEVGFRKKGKHSACVGRQYLGCIGKHDNGQVAVVAGLSAKKHYIPIDVQLFMPEPWANDPLRRQKAKIPEELHFLTKPEIALQMVLQQKKQETRFDYVCFDALYGSSKQFIKTLADNHIRFIGDTKANVSISTVPIDFEVPTRNTGKGGAKFLFKRPVQPLQTVKEYVETLTPDDFECIDFRNGTKQSINAYFHSKRVWMVPEKEQSLPLTLIIRKEADGKIKYSFTYTN